MLAVATLSIILATAATGQQVGTYTPEEHPKISWQKCTEDNCSAVNGELVLDANYRWLHKVDGYLNCYEGNEWTDLCDSPEDCAAICAVDGAEYKTVVCRRPSLILDTHS
jgi:cellulose 1,4-beta-cellobiosidase